jgi:hypothetical protein
MPTETQPPLIIDPNGVLPFADPFSQCFGGVSCRVMLGNVREL